MDGSASVLTLEDASLKLFGGYDKNYFSVCLLDLCSKELVYLLRIIDKFFLICIPSLFGN